MVPVGSAGYQVKLDGAGDTARTSPTRRSMSKLESVGVESTGTTTAESPIKTNPTIDWDGPFCERNAYDTLTGYTFVRCPDCEIEVLTGRRDHATHRPECGHR